MTYEYPSFRAEPGGVTLFAAYDAAFQTRSALQMLSIGLNIEL